MPIKIIFDKPKFQIITLYTKGIGFNLLYEGDTIKNLHSRSGVYFYVDLWNKRFWVGIRFWTVKEK